jgi:hypothetical protein
VVEVLGVVQLSLLPLGESIYEFRA